VSQYAPFVRAESSNAVAQFPAVGSEPLPPWQTYKVSVYAWAIEGISKTNKNINFSVVFIISVAPEFRM
jgi:hypothetical protein